jgi:hypothetical protein
MRFIDPDGMGTESVNVDKFGTVLKNVDDGDNHVYEHDNAKTTADVDKNYSAKNTAAGGKDIGELGVNIDVTSILTNLLQADRAIAQIINKDEWIAKVLPNQVWDLKNNTGTIFGVAWAYDAKAQQEAQEGTTLKHTSFNMGVTKFQDAAAVGNCHAGYTGTHANLSRIAQYRFAGLGEVAKPLY